MSEFVERNLERLLPLYERLRVSQVFTKNEVKEFINRCRGYEYRLQKNLKDPSDFMLYADYLRDVLKLIRIRCKRLKIHRHYRDFDETLLAKISEVLRFCCERFKGHRKVWRKCIDFLKEEKMQRSVSKVYFRALQVYSRDTDLRLEAARWELNENFSIENARLHMQFALRQEPSRISVWSTFLDIEMRYVDRLMKRRAILEGKVDEKARRNNDSESADTIKEKKEETDAILDLKLAEVIVRQALMCEEITDKSALVFSLWKVAHICGLSNDRLEVFLYDWLWTEGNICEESWIAKYERSMNKTDFYALFDAAVASLPSEKMIRYYIGQCRKRLESEDFSAAVKLHDLYEMLHLKGFASMSDYEEMLLCVENESEKRKYLNSALKSFPKCASFWSRLIHSAISSPESTKKEVRALFNRAEESVEPEDMLEIWKLAIDWTLSTNPEKVDDLFDRAILVAPSSVSAEIKCIRLRYLEEEFPNDRTRYRKEYQRMVSCPPTPMVVHKQFIDLELKADPDLNVLRQAYENYVASYGFETFECWIDYGKFLIKYDPAAVSSLYQRAIVSIPASCSDEFSIAWTLLMQNIDPFSKIEASVETEERQFTDEEVAVTKKKRKVANEEGTESMK